MPAGFKSGNLQVVDGHAPVVHIPQAGFRVNFPAWSTQRAINGDCVLSRVPRSGTDFLYAASISPELAGTGTGFTLVPDLPVEVITADFKIGEQPFWFGPPGTRIPVGGTFAIPGPPQTRYGGDGRTGAGQL